MFFFYLHDVSLFGSPRGTAFLSPGRRQSSRCRLSLSPRCCFCSISTTYTEPTMYFFQSPRHSLFYLHDVRFFYLQTVRFLYPRRTFCSWFCLSRSWPWVAWPCISYLALPSLASIGLVALGFALLAICRFNLDVVGTWNRVLPKIVPRHWLHTGVEAWWSRLRKMPHRNRKLIQCVCRSIRSESLNTEVPLFVAWCSPVH